MSLPAQFITRLIQVGSVKKNEHLAREEFFDPFHWSMYQGVLSYEMTYGRCMDEATFKDSWPNSWEPTELQLEYLADIMAQNHIESAVTRMLTEFEDELPKNPREMTRRLANDLREIYFRFGTLDEPFDLIEAGAKRIQALKDRRLTMRGLTGITLGFDLLDSATCGTQPADIEFWVGRPGNGKTFLILYGCYRAHMHGKRISFVSPEMTAEQIGLRLDAFMYNVSQLGFLSGRAAIEEYDDYYQAFANRKQTGGRFFFRDAFKLGRRFTTDDLALIIEHDKPDLLAIDGLLHLEPAKEARDLRGRVTAVVEELRNLTVSSGVPMRIAHQANRVSDQNRTGKRKQDTKATDFIPDLTNLAEAAATEQFADRVICHKLDSESKRMYIAVRKNRTGPEGTIVCAEVDIDRGRIGTEVDASAIEDQAATTSDDLRDPANSF